MMKVKYDGEGKMFLHQEIGKGQMPDDVIGFNDIGLNQLQKK